MATLAVTARADLTDAQWAVLEPLLPRGKKPGRPPERTKRQLIDGIRWRTRTGSPWRDVPPAYGPWQTVYAEVAVALCKYRALNCRFGEIRPQNVVRKSACCYREMSGHDVMIWI